MSSAVEKKTSVVITKEIEELSVKEKSIVKEPVVVEHHTTTIAQDDKEQEQLHNEEKKECNDKPKQSKSTEQENKKGRVRDRRHKGHNMKGGAWKKLDVEVNFSNKKESSTGDSNTNNKETPSSSSPNNTLRKGASSPPNKHQTKKKQSQNQQGGAKKSDENVTKTQQQQNNRRHHNQQHRNKNYHHHNNRNRKSQNKNKKNNNNDQVQDEMIYEQQEYSQPFPILSPSELAEAKVKVTKQIEYFFSTAELSRNTYLRHQMDTQGYLPAAIVFNFPSVVAYGVPYQDLIQHISEASSFLDVDVENETMRVNVGWETWLYPNGEGGLGCPRWIKQPQLQEQQQLHTINTTLESIQPAPDLVHSTDSETEDEHSEKQFQDKEISQTKKNELNIQNHSSIST